MLPANVRKSGGRRTIVQPPTNASLAPAIIDTLKMTEKKKISNYKNDCFINVLIPNKISTSIRFIKSNEPSIDNLGK